MFLFKVGQDFLNFRKQADLRLVRVRELREVVARVVVALNDGRAVFGQAYVPSDIAHLRYLKRRLQDHFLDFLHKREAIAYKSDASVGMLIVVDKLRGMPLPCNLPLIEVKVARKPSVFKVVNKLSVVAHFKYGIQDMRYALLDNRTNPQAVERIGINPRRGFVLSDDLFNYAEVLLPARDVSVKLIQVVERGNLNFFNSLTAFPDIRLCKKVFPAAYESFKFMEAEALKVEHLAAEIFCKPLVKDVFLVKNIAVVLII